MTLLSSGQQQPAADERLRRSGYHPESSMVGGTGTGLLVTTLPPWALDRAAPTTTSLPSPSTTAGWWLLGHGSSSSGSGSSGSGSIRNSVLRDFARTRMIYQMLSCVAVRGDLEVGLYGGEAPRFAFVFDPARCVVAAGAVENMGSGDRADRSAGLADAYLTSLLTVDEGGAPISGTVSSVDDALESLSLEDQLAAQRALLAELQKQHRPDQQDEATRTDDVIAPATDSTKGVQRAQESTREYLESHGLMSDPLNLSSLPFEVFVSPPRLCPWPYGDWPPPSGWWTKNNAEHKTAFPHSQQQYESAQGAIQTRANVVAASSSDDVLRRVFMKQQEWFEVVKRWRAVARDLPPSWTAEERARFERFLQRGSGGEHNEVLVHPLGLDSLVGVLLLRTGEDDAAALVADRETAMQWATAYAQLRASVEPLHRAQLVWVGRYIRDGGSSGAGIVRSQIVVDDVAESSQSRTCVLTSAPWRHLGRVGTERSSVSASAVHAKMSLM